MSLVSVGAVSGFTPSFWPVVFTQPGRPAAVLTRTQLVCGHCEPVSKSDTVHHAGMRPWPQVMSRERGRYF